LLTPAASLRGERPHREQAEKDHQGDRGTMAVERVHSLASPGKGTEGHLGLYANGTAEGLLSAHPSSTPGIRHAGQRRLLCTRKGAPVHCRQMGQIGHRETRVPPVLSSSLQSESNPRQDR